MAFRFVGCSTTGPLNIKTYNPFCLMTWGASLRPHEEHVHRLTTNYCLNLQQCTTVLATHSTSTQVSLRLKAKDSKQSAREQGSLLMKVMTAWTRQPAQNLKITKLQQQQQQPSSSQVGRASMRGLKESPQQLRMMLQAQGAALGRNGGSGRVLHGQGQASSMNVGVQQATELQVWQNFFL